MKFRSTQGGVSRAVRLNQAVWMALLLCIASAAGAGAKAEKPWEFPGIWTTHVDSQSGPVDTRCEFRKDHSFRCDTKIGTVTSYFGVGRYNVVTTSPKQFLLNYEMDATSPINAGKRFTAMYEIVDTNTIRALSDGAVSRRELNPPARAKKKQISSPPADAAHST